MMQFEPMELEPIRAGQERLARVFSDEYAFSIPAYQRPYAWETEQARDLLEDVMAALGEAKLTKDPVTYFLGSIVLIKQPGSPEARVVDGQQRLTTLTILLSVLRDLSAESIAWKRHQYVCEEGDPDRGTKSRYRLTLRKRDADFFLNSVQQRGATLSLPATDGLSDSRLRIVENAKLFHSRLAAMDNSERDALVAFLLQRCYLVVISVANVEMAHRVFTVLNARGLDLSPTDILKADLLDRVPPEEEPAFAEGWEGLEAALGRERFVELFQHVRMIHQREKPRERLELGFKRHVTDFARPRVFLTKVLKPYGAAYQRILTDSEVAAAYGPEAARRLRFLRQLDNYDWLPPTISFLSSTTRARSDVELFLKLLETLAYKLFVTRADINARIARYAQVLKDIADGLPPSDPAAAVRLSPQERSQFLAALDGPIYEMTRVRMPLLLRLDAELSAGGAAYDHGVVSVEHVLPQNPADDSEWLKLFPDPEVRGSWTHRLANLVLLTRAKNAQASNWDFDIKKEQYFKGAGGVSHFAVTTQVLAEGSWTPETLERRQRAVLNHLSSTWGLA